MDFRLTEDLELWRKTVREFTENEVAPHDEAMDRACLLYTSNPRGCVDHKAVSKVTPVERYLR